MNVFIYGGKDRFTATKKIVPENRNPTKDEIYAFDYREGIVVVAFPKKD